MFNLMDNFELQAMVTRGYLDETIEKACVDGDLGIVKLSCVNWCTSR